MQQILLVFVEPLFIARFFWGLVDFELPWRAGRFNLVRVGRLAQRLARLPYTE